MNLLTRTDEQLTVRNRIENLESSLREEIEKGNIEQTIEDCAEDNSQANHYFGEGVYCRSLLIPKDTVVVGKLHKYDRVCIIASGVCTFVNEFEEKTVEAPWVGEFKAGSKTAVFAHEDTLWVACTAGNKERDADALIDVLVTDTHDKYIDHVKTLEKLS